MSNPLKDDGQRRALAWLKENKQRWIDEIVALANENSGSDNLEGLNRVAEMLSSWGGFAETKFERVSLPARQSLMDDGSTLTRETGPALQWEVRSQARHKILLGIHYDTVYTPGQLPNRCHF